MPSARSCIACGIRRAPRGVAIAWRLGVLVMLSAGVVRAQDSPVLSYTTKDGLTHDSVHRVIRDARGFLWIGTSTALTRFDGERFTGYSKPQGLEVGTGINDIREDGGSRLWVATNGAGVFRFDLTSADPAKRFTQLQVGHGRAANRVNTLAVLATGAIWAGTDAGLFLGSATEPFQRVPLPIPEGQLQAGVQITALLADGAWIWIGTPRGAFRCGQTAAAGCVAGPAVNVLTLQIDRRRRLWFAGASGAYVASIDAAGAVGPARTFAAGARVRRLTVASDDTMLMALEDGRVLAVVNDIEQQLFSSTDGARLNDIAEDTARNLWIATNLGLVTIRRQGVTMLSSRHGLRSPYVRTLVRSASAQVYALTEDEWLHKIEGARLSGVRLQFPSGVRRSAWPHTSVHVDSAGDAWLGTASGLLRYRSPFAVWRKTEELQPDESYSKKDGLAGDHISDVFEDAHGDIWIANVPADGGSLTVWRRATQQFERLGIAHGLPAFNQPSGFSEDTHGAIWARLREGGVVRIRGTRAAVFGVDRGLPPLVTAILIARDGQMWIGGSDVVARISDTAAESITATNVLTGIGSTIRSMAEDHSGNILLGTYDGLLSFDSRSRSLRRFSSFEGLPRANMDTLVRDRDGAVLAVAGRSLARLAPKSNEWWDSPPRCLLSAIRVGSRSLTLPETGLERGSAFEVLPAQNNVEIEFLGLSPRFGEPLEYEYRLTGVSTEWTRAAQRRVSYAGLASGRYTFEVRAASANASVSAPASVAFTVLPPWYRRWWFLSFVAAAGLFAAYRVHRVRLAQAVRTERLRSRIATDLHDDIGSSLSQIAILAEVARRRAGDKLPGVAEPLGSIATTSRDLVDAMSDIVWAVNPRTDSLSDLMRRMHRFAEETLGGADIALKFTAPSQDGDIKLGADLRRELYLILKESVNNIARHSGATSATVDLALTRQELRLTIVDNGRGFDPSTAVDGNGIASMRKRAAAFGGVFEIETAPGHGTRVSMCANLRRQ